MIMRGHMHNNIQYDCYLLFVQTPKKKTYVNFWEAEPT